MPVCSLSVALTMMRMQKGNKTYRLAKEIIGTVKTDLY